MSSNLVRCLSLICYSLGGYYLSPYRFRSRLSCANFSRVSRFASVVNLLALLTHSIRCRSVWSIQPLGHGKDEQYTQDDLSESNSCLVAKPQHKYLKTTNESAIDAETGALAPNLYKLQWLGFGRSAGRYIPSCRIYRKQTLGLQYFPSECYLIALFLQGGGAKHFKQLSESIKR